MFDHDDDGVQGIAAETLVDSLSENGAGYVLEITTDGAGDNVLVESGAFGDDIIYAEVDFGETNNLNSDLNMNLNNENCMRLTGANGSELTVVADGRNFIAYDEASQEAEVCDSRSELSGVVESWICGNGKKDSVFDPDEGDDDDWNEDDYQA